MDTGGIALSGLLGEPEGAPTRAVVVALHGAGMSADYFHCMMRPDLSLVALSVQLGYTVLALDRPGYGASAQALPQGQTLREQAVVVRAALEAFRESRPVGAGFFLLAHSFGGNLALAVAAWGEADDLIGLDISGCGNRYANADGAPRANLGRSWRRSWGPLRCYPPGTFRSSESVVAPVPDRELRDAQRWLEIFADVAPRVRVPVRFTFAEHESWWRHDDDALADLTDPFTASPRVLVDRLPGSGHNISLGWTARAYHLKALGFLEECMASGHRTR